MFTIALETPADAGGIEDLLDLTFGSDRFAKAVYALRREVPPLASLSFTGSIDEALIATLRFWPALVDGRWPILVLGPIAVRPDLQGQGFGIRLLQHGLAEAAAQGWGAVALVGDEPYYARVGFSREAAAALRLPGLAQPERLLARDLKSGSLALMSGPIGQARRVRAA